MFFLFLLFFCGLIHAMERDIVQEKSFEIIAVPSLKELCLEVVLNNKEPYSQISKLPRELSDMLQQMSNAQLGAIKSFVFNGFSSSCIAEDISFKACPISIDALDTKNKLIGSNNFTHYNIINYETGELVKSIKYSEEFPVDSVFNTSIDYSFFCNNHIVITHSRKKRIIIANSLENSAICRITEKDNIYDSNEIRQIDISPDGKTLFLMAQERKVYSIDIESKNIINRFTFPNRPGMRSKFFRISADGKKLFLVQDHRDLPAPFRHTIFDTTGGTCGDQFQNTNEMSNVWWEPTSKYIFILYINSDYFISLKKWNWQDHELHSIFEKEYGIISNIVWSQDNSLFAYAKIDGETTISIYDNKTDQHLLSFHILDDSGFEKFFGFNDKNELIYISRNRILRLPIQELLSLFDSLTFEQKQSLKQTMQAIEKKSNTILNDDKLLDLLPPLLKNICKEKIDNYKLSLLPNYFNEAL